MNGEIEFQAAYAAPIIKSTLFESVGLFMLRTPLLPIEKFHDLNKSGDDILIQLREISQKEIILESIAVASPSLLTALSNLAGSWDDRKTKQAASGLLRYLLRMCTRPTPFGLFSGVAIGNLTENTGIQFNQKEMYRKRTRPDMEWLLAVVRNLEQRRDIVKQLRVRRNHAAFQIGGRIMLPFITACGQVNRETDVIMEHVSIRATEPALLALDLADHPVPFAVLVQNVSEHYPGVEIKRVEDLVWQLFCQEFLISELRPPLTIASPFHYVIQHLSSIAGVEKEYKALLEIRNLILHYDEISLGKGLNTYQDLVKRMNKIHVMDKPLQVDMGLSTKQANIHRQVGEEIARAAECLWKLSMLQHGFNHMRQYHRKFLERYGTVREIPILHVLSEEIGLGSPSTYKFPQGREKDPERPKPSAEKEEVLTRLLFLAVRNHQEEVEITEELLDLLAEKEIDFRNAPESLEIFAEVIARSAECVNRGEFLLVIGPNPGSQSAGQSFGRFLDFLGDGTYKKLKKLNEQLENQNPDVVYLEVSYLPNSGHSANVAMSPIMRTYEMAIGTNPSGVESSHVLALDDLLVGATLDRLYLKSRSLDKEVVVTSGHMLNYTNAPNVYRFLRELSMEGVRNWQPFSWGTLESSPYLPRVRYGRTVLSPAIWRLTPSILGTKVNPKDDAAWDKLFGEWRKAWTVPRYVFMTYADNRLLLDLDDPLHVMELRKELFRMNGITLREMISGFDCQWAEGTDGHYIMECVFPLIKRTEVRQTRLYRSPSKTSFVPDELRVRVPGSDWMFLKLYGAESRADELISQMVTPFSENIVHHGVADNWFYIRYLDPEPHIRLRFHGDPKQLSASLLPLIHDWANKLIKEGVIQRVVIDTYEREVERYGGPDLIASAERVFGTDSVTSGQLLNFIHQKQIDCSKEVLTALGITILMNQFGWGFEKQVDWLDSVVNKHEYSQDYRLVKRQLLEWMNPTNDWGKLKEARNGQLILETFRKRESSLRRMGMEVSKAHSNGGLWNAPEMLVGSLIHMHCNRMMGVDRDKERKALSFARHSLFALSHMNQVLCDESKISQSKIYLRT